MKIGFDSKRLFCNFTGLGNYSRTLLLNLGKFHPENDYHLYTPGMGKSPEIIPFLQNTRYKVHVPPTLLKSYWRSYSIKDQLKADGIPVYHGLSNEIPVNIHKTGIKSVVTIHDLIFKIHPETYAPADRMIYDIKFRYACRHANRIIAISECTKNDIVRLYSIDPQKIEVIYQACNPIYYQEANQAKDDLIRRKYNLPADYLLSVGRIEPRKNLKMIIESYRFLGRDQQIPLVVIGKGGKYRLEAEQLARKAGLEKLVIWINSLESAEDLKSFYRNSNALIYPSRYEGFGLPVTEALLCKTPVITSDRSSLKEAGGPGSIYVDPDSPAEIAAAIEKVLAGSELREQMMTSGFIYARRNFEPERLTKQVVDCYQKTLKQ